MIKTILGVDVRKERKRYHNIVNAKIIYQLGFPGCDYLIEINEQLYEADNLNEWQNFLFYVDTQYVDLDFIYTNEISNCSGLEKINIFCLRNI